MTDPEKRTHKYSIKYSIKKYSIKEWTNQHLHDCIVFIAVAIISLNQFLYSNFSYQKFYKTPLFFKIKIRSDYF